MEETYRIVAHGVQPGYAEEQAAQLLAAMFKCSTSKVKPMLTDKGVVVKKALTLAAATKYQGALERCGCTSRIEPEQETAAEPADPLDWKKRDKASKEFALTRFTPEEMERINDYAQQVLDILNEKFSGKAAYDKRSVEFLSAELNARRRKYTGAVGVKIANLYGAFLGKVLIETYADAKPVWVKTPEGVGIHFRKHGSRFLKLAFPITRVIKQIEHGESHSILAFVEEQKQFLAEDPAPKKRRALKSAVVQEKGPHAIVKLPADGAPFNLVLPYSICCNCGTSKEIHAIQVPLPARRFIGTDLSIDMELPFCVPCVPSAHRVRPSVQMQALAVVGALLLFSVALLWPFGGAQVLGVPAGAWMLPVFAALCAGALYLLNRATAPQTSAYQPVTLRTVKAGAGGISQIGFNFSNPAYAKEFVRANKQEIKKGRVV